MRRLFLAFTALSLFVAIPSSFAAAPGEPADVFGDADGLFGPPGAGDSAIGIPDFADVLRGTCARAILAAQGPSLADARTAFAAADPFLVLDERLQLTRMILRNPHRGMRNASTELMPYLGPTAVTRAYGEFAGHGRIDVASMDGADTSLLGAMEALRSVSGGNSRFVDAVFGTYSGARAIAFKAIGDIPRSEAALLQFWEEQRDGDNLAFGLTLEKVREQIRAAAGERDVHKRYDAAEKFFRQLFHGSERLYDVFAHDPFIVPFIHFVHEHGRARFAMAAEALELLESNIQARALVMTEELTRFLQQRLPDPGVQVALMAYLAGTAPRILHGGAGGVQIRDMEMLYDPKEHKPEPWESYFHAVAMEAQQLFGDLAGYEQLGMDLALRNDNIAAAIEMFVRRLPDAADAFLDAALDSWDVEFGTEAPTDRASVRASVRVRLEAIAGNRDVERAFATAVSGVDLQDEFRIGLRDYPQALTAGLGEDHRMRVFSFRPQQVEGVQVVAQVGRLDAAAKVLEIGFGAPSALRVLSLVLPNRVVGLERDSVPALPRKMVNPPLLVHGNVPEDAAAAAKVTEAGPYRAIFSVDVHKAILGFGGQFLPGVGSVEYLRFIHSQLEEGGVFVMLNDYKKANVFSAEEVAEAGLTVVTWNETRHLSDREKKMFFGTAQWEDSGNMRLTILRKGTVDRAHWPAPALPSSVLTSVDDTVENARLQYDEYLRAQAEAKAEYDRQVALAAEAEPAAAGAPAPAPAPTPGVEPDPEPTPTLGPTPGPTLAPPPEPEAGPAPAPK